MGVLTLGLVIVYLFPASFWVADQYKQETLFKNLFCYTLLVLPTLMYTFLILGWLFANILANGLSDFPKILPNSIYYNAVGELVLAYGFSIYTYLCVKSYVDGVQGQSLRSEHIAFVLVYKKPVEYYLF